MAEMYLVEDPSRYPWGVKGEEGWLYFEVPHACGECLEAGTVQLGHIACSMDWTNLSAESDELEVAAGPQLNGSSWRVLVRREFTSKDVFVLIYQEADVVEVVGVFTSRPLAEAAKEDEEKKHSWREGWRRWISLSVEESTLNG